MQPLELHGFEDEMPLKELHKDMLLSLKRFIEIQMFPWAKFFRNDDEILYAGYVKLIWIHLGLADYFCPQKKQLVSKKFERLRMWHTMFFCVKRILAAKRQKVYSGFKEKYDCKLMTTVCADDALHYHNLC